LRREKVHKNNKTKKKYKKPEIVFEKIFETGALQCGKCSTGPISQAACRGNPQKS
jgi:aerobic-type carbon monoxide dehydrogenase small subunit (CoxS/CutS family)